MSDSTLRPYVAFWERQRHELHAVSSHAAQSLAVEHFQRLTRKKVKAWDVSVILADVVHSTAEVG